MDLSIDAAPFSVLAHLARCIALLSGSLAILPKASCTRFLNTLRASSLFFVLLYSAKYF